MSQLHPYLVSLAVGMVVGALYAGLSVRSPAPPLSHFSGSSVWLPEKLACNG